ncbi:unnamed protein product, partial [Closterium sp. NIES-65]
PGDPCRKQSYKGDQDLYGMNPCGRFPCQETNGGHSCSCNISPFPQAMRQPFVEVDNGYGSKTCAYVDVCGSYFKNPCYVGTCINDLKGSYSSICPPNHIERATNYGFPTCDPADTTATSMTVSGDNWQCSDVYPSVGISMNNFFSNNPGINCSQPLDKGTILQLAGTPGTPCTAFFYTIKGDTCSSISSQLDGINLDILNPGLDCSSNNLKAGLSICIERSADFAYNVFECSRYSTLTSQDTCQVLFQRAAKESGSTWADLYRSNPGLTCSRTIPSGTELQ